MLEPSFAAIHEVLREIRPFEHKFQAKNFGAFEGYQICQKTVHKINTFHSHFHIKLKPEGRNKPSHSNFIWKCEENLVTL